jgi:hypothetical protein
VRSSRATAPAPWALTHSTSAATSATATERRGRARDSSGSSVATFDDRTSGTSPPLTRGQKARVWLRAALWKVAALTPSRPPAGTPRAWSRPAISRAALSVKVTARICDGDAAPARTWLAIRSVTTRVLPVPGPASTRSGPRTSSTARRWAGSRRAMAAGPYQHGGTPRPEAPQGQRGRPGRGLGVRDRLLAAVRRLLPPRRGAAPLHTNRRRPSRTSPGTRGSGRGRSP